MAASIVIARKTGVALSSLGFDLVVESTREILKVSAPDLIASIYETFDDQSMPFICLDNLSASDFMRFYVATKKAYSDWQIKNRKKFSDWNELLAKMEADERYKRI